MLPKFQERNISLVGMTSANDTDHRSQILPGNPMIYVIDSFCEIYKHCSEPISLIFHSYFHPFLQLMRQLFIFFGKPNWCDNGFLFCSKETKKSIIDDPCIKLTQQQNETNGSIVSGVSFVTIVIHRSNFSTFGELRKKKYFWLFIWRKHPEALQQQNQKIRAVCYINYQMTLVYCYWNYKWHREPICWHDKQKTPLQDVDHSGNDPRLAPGFLSRRSGMFPERLQRMFVHVGSKEIRPLWTEHPRCGTLSRWIPGTVYWLCPHLFRNLFYILLSDSGSRYVLRLDVPRRLLCFPWHSCQLSLISQWCHLWEKSSTVVKTELSVFLWYFLNTTKM